jgi:hypothetical protein
MSTKSRQISLRLSDEEVALLPDCANSSEAVRMLMAKGARIQEVETIVDQRIDKLHDKLSAALDKTIRSVASDLHERERVALEMVLFNLRAIYEGTLRTEAVTTAALYGLVDADATSEALEDHLRTRFESHMSKLWPLFVAENDRGLKSLRGAPRDRADSAKTADRNTQADVGRSETDSPKPIGAQKDTRADAAT